MTEQRAALALIETGTLLDFEIADKKIKLSPDEENVYVKVNLQIVGDDDTEAEEIVEWGAFGFIFLIATLSFSDARPRGNSAMDYQQDDQLSVADFFDGLTYCRSDLRVHADYIRGRSLKTDIAVRPDGTVSVNTWGRGESLLRWLDRMKGKKHLQTIDSKLADWMKSNSFILQLTTVTVNRMPYRTTDRDTSIPIFCYIEVDKTLSDKIKSHHATIIKSGITSLSLIDTSPQWRFPPNRSNEPTKIRTSCLTISHNYVSLSVALHDLLDDLETSRSPIEIFVPDDTDFTDAHNLRTDYRRAQVGFKRLTALNNRLEEISDYHCGLYEVEEALDKLNMPMEAVVGPEFTKLVDAASIATDKLQTEYDELEEKVTEIAWQVCQSALGIREGQDFAALDRQSRLICIKVAYVSIDVAGKPAYLYGNK